MAEQVAPIRGRVARILNSRELALNIGSKHGVAVGMRFDVLDPKGESITDPETEEILGSVERPKVRVKVLLVQERLSIANTYRTREVNVGGRGGAFSTIDPELFMPTRWVARPETLKATDRALEDLDEQHSYVKSGDPVRQVLDDEDDGAAQGR